MKIALFSNSDRGHWVNNAIYAAGHTCKHILDEDINSTEFLEHYADELFDLAIVAGYPTIFCSELIHLPKMGTWNCHAGPVPEYRGGSPLNWQIINGRKMIDITLLQMDEGIDTGDVLATRRFKLNSDETINDAHCKAGLHFQQMVKEALLNPPTPMPQKGDGYKSQRNDDMGEIDPSWDAERIYNFVRALSHPYPGAYIKDNNGKKVRIWSVSMD